MRNDKSIFRDNFSVPGCLSCQRCPENYNFHVRSCWKKTGRNVTAKIKEIVDGAQEQADALTNGDWVLCWSGLDDAGDGEKVWLGRCVNNRKDKRFSLGVTWRNDTGKIQKNVGAGKMKLQRDEVGVTVQWYDRCRVQLNPDHCVQYKVCDNLPPVVQSATSIISSKFQVIQMEGALATTAYTRRQNEATVATSIPNKYMTTASDNMKRQMRETWELDLGTYEHGENAVDWFCSR